MENTFELVVHFSAPIAIPRNSYWTLDAICYGILEDLTEQGLVSSTAIPLYEDEGLYYASMALIEPNTAVDQNLTLTGGIRPVIDMIDATTFIQGRTKNKIAKIANTRGHFKNHLSRYQIISMETVRWIAKGDGKAIANLIRHAGSLGALRKIGYGIVSDIEVIENNNLNPLFDHETASVLRPIPVDHAAKLSNQIASLRGMDTWKPPYWHRKDSAPCFLPSHYPAQ